MRLFMISFLIIGFVACSPRLTRDYSWTSKRWVLVEMKEVPVQQSGGRRDAFLRFNATDKKFNGQGGCNSLSGDYSLSGSSRIKFGEVMSTKMSCEDIQFENTFVSLLAAADHIEVDENRMTIKDGRKVILVFEGR